MVHHEQRHMIEEMRLPELRRNAHVVDAVVRPKLVAGNPDPVLRLAHASRILSVDSQAQRRAPEKVGDEAHASAIPRKHPRTRSLQTLLRDNHVIHRRAELRLRVAVRPHDARHVDAGARPEAEVNRCSSHDLRLDGEAGPYADLSANAEGVDSLITRCRLAARPNQLPVIACATPVGHQPERAAHHRCSQIEPAVVVSIGGREYLAVRRHGQRLEAMLLAAQPDSRRSRDRTDEVECGVVVQVGDEQNTRAGSGACELGPGRDLFDRPGRACPGRLADGSTRVERQHVNRAVCIQVGHSGRHDSQ